MRSNLYKRLILVVNYFTILREANKINIFAFNIRSEKKNMKTSKSREKKYSRKEKLFKLKAHI